MNKQFLEVTKNHIKTKVRAQVTLDLNIYKAVDSDKIDDADYEQITGGSSSFYIPGTFEIHYETGETDKFFFPFKVNLHKTQDVEITSSFITINYEPGDTILSAFVKVDETNISVVDALFENRVKYLNGAIGKQVETLWEQLESTIEYNPVHLELLLSLMYIEKENGEFKYTRHTNNQSYQAENAVGTKISSHIFNHGVASSAYGYTNDQIITSVLKSNNFTDVEEPEYAILPTTKDFNLLKDKSDLEKIVAGNYKDL